VEEKLCREAAVTKMYEEAVAYDGVPRSDYNEDDVGDLLHGSSDDDREWLEHLLHVDTNVGAESPMRGYPRHPRPPSLGIGPSCRRDLDHCEYWTSREDHAKELAVQETAKASVRAKKKR
jgi:hypothetical protein